MFAKVLEKACTQLDRAIRLFNLRKADKRQGF